MTRALPPAALLLILLISAPTLAQDSDALRIDLKLGVESDSNANRTEGQGTQSDVLTRYFLKIESAASLGPTQSLSLKFRSGGKSYGRFGQEDALLTQGDVQYVLLPLAGFDPDQRWLFLYSRASLKDRTERGSLRDYIRGSVVGGVGLRLGPVTLTGGGGGSFFVFKPDSQSSNTGRVAELGASWAISDAWSIRTGFNFQSRDYLTARQVERTAEEDFEAVLRNDRLQVVTAGIGWRGWAVVSLDGSWVLNASNSRNQSIQRFGAAVSATVPLPWSFLVSTRLSLQRTLYDDPRELLGNALTVDEDNRNSLVVEVEREIYGPVSAALRYALYTQEFGVEESDYTRQLLFLGLGLEY